MGRRKLSLCLAVFLLAPLLLVHYPEAVRGQSPQPKPRPGQQRAAPAPQVHYATETLPQPVRELRDTLTEAIQSGKIEDLRYAYDLNDIKPDLGLPAGADPVAHWRKISGDGEGREVLAALSLLLEAGYVALPLGADPENNRLYIWPYFAEVPLGTLSPAQEVELLRLVPPAKAREMKATGKYTHWRLAIGADGSWHSFRKSD
jgi:hypothetical protein